MHIYIYIMAEELLQLRYNKIKEVFENKIDNLNKMGENINTLAKLKRACIRYEYLHEGKKRSETIAIRTINSIYVPEDKRNIMGCDSSERWGEVITDHPLSYYLYMLGFEIECNIEFLHKIPDTEILNYNIDIVYKVYTNTKWFSGCINGKVVYLEIDNACNTYKDLNEYKVNIIRYHKCTAMNTNNNNND